MTNILYRADCKEAIKKLISEGISVDLIYLDPPFNSNRVYNMMYTDSDKYIAFRDIWTLTPENHEMVLQFDKVLDGNSDISDLLKDFLKVRIAALKNSTVEDQKLIVYLVYMTERLVLMKQILTPAGSIYLHCDPTASHYIKIVMDGIFGQKNFRNEIVWSYKRWTTISKDFQKTHDILLRYSNGDRWAFNTQYQDYSTSTLKGYSVDEETGKRFRKKSLKGRIFTIWENELGVKIGDVWEFPGVHLCGRERVGYPTQKPLALLKRIILASSNEGDIVLDPFCGSGTTVIVAVQNKRKWIGIDVSCDAMDVTKKRIKDITFAYSVTYEERDDNKLSMPPTMHAIKMQRDNECVQQLHF